MRKEKNNLGKPIDSGSLWAGPRRLTWDEGDGAPGKGARSWRGADGWPVGHRGVPMTLLGEAGSEESVDRVKQCAFILNSTT